MNRLKTMAWRSVLLSSLFLFVPGCATFFSGGIPSDPLERLRYDIDQVLTDSNFASVIPSVKIVEAASGKVLYERYSDLYIRPASNMKLLTSAAALHVLGPAYRFKTSVAYDSLTSADSVRGNLYLKGYGNPDLSTKDIDSLAFAVAVSGIRHVSGDLVVDPTFFDSLQWGTGWMWDDEPAPYQAYVSGLGVNRNCVLVTVFVDSVTGKPIVQTDPETDYIRVINDARVVTDSVRTRLSVARPVTHTPNTIVVSGEMLPFDEPHEEQVTVLWPELYAGTLFQEALARYGVHVSGGVRRGILPLSVAERFSHTWGLDSAVVHLNKVSDNLSAEMSLKTISAVVNGPPGSATLGRYVVNGFLNVSGIDTMRHRQADGSGLSHYSLLRVGLLVDILVAMYQRPDVFPLFYESLPIAGVDGTLEDRMKGTLAENNVHAKTGTISGVSSLSGYVHTRDGEVLAFGMTMQDFIAPSGRYRRAQDRICALLAGFSRQGKGKSGR